jgi:hypothetical protein
LVIFVNKNFYTCSNRRGFTGFLAADWRKNLECGGLTPLCYGQA